MKYKQSSLPAPSVGDDYSKVKSIVVPDQSLSLKDILTRFTRGEPLNVAHPVAYGVEGMDTDLEKLSNADLVDKAEYMDKLKNVQKLYDKQEKAKAAKEAADKAAADKLAEQKRIRMEAKKLAAKESSKKSA